MTGTSWNGHRFFGLRTSKSFRAARPGRCSEVDADTANVGAGPATLVHNTAGQSVSNATLTPGGQARRRSVVRIPASEIENRVARAVGAHLAVQQVRASGVGFPAPKIAWLPRRRPEFRIRKIQVPRWP